MNTQNQLSFTLNTTSLLAKGLTAQVAELTESLGSFHFKSEPASQGLSEAKKKKKKESLMLLAMSLEWAPGGRHEPSSE